MADKKASKKDVDVKKEEEPVKKTVVFHDKIINRRGREVTLRTYDDGTSEEFENE
tara:strand:+ start:373 stop:537 length:165 start_codon:yes stop_codon:yes gene_type:complete